MREYTKVASSFWTGETGKKLRAHGRDTQLVAAYLISCRSANWLGLYYLPLPVLCHELGMTEKGAMEALRRASEAEFGFYDSASEHAWVPEMASYQIGDALEVGDKRIKGILKDLEAFRKTPFFNAFLERYGAAFQLKGISPSEAPSKGLPSPIEGPSKPGAGAGTPTGAGEGARTENDVCGEVPLAPAPPDPIVLFFPVVGNGAKEWELRQSKVAEYSESFPGVDVLAQCKIARQWCIDRPRERKTAVGMPGFLSRWLTKEQNRGRAPGDRGAAVRATLTPATEKVIRAFKIAKGHGDDAGWNSLMLEKCIQPANQVLAYFGGRWEDAVRCIEEVRDNLSEQFPNWGWEAIIRAAPEFKNKVAA